MAGAKTPRGAQVSRPRQPQDIDRKRAVAKADATRPTALRAAGEARIRNKAAQKR